MSFREPDCLKMPLSPAQVQQFKIDGYLVLPGVLNADELSNLWQLTTRHLTARIPPFELEADVQYPGAPQSTSTTGGDTIRRLLNAYRRDPALAALANRPQIVSGIKQILDCNSLYLNPNHHNCVMTKHPAYSSETLWHRDTRYWNFDNKYLINSWFALGDEQQANGAMKILPGSHRWEVQEDALDAAQFLILDHADNLDRLATQRLVTLNAGDALLFSAHCFHAAGKNTTENPKYSAVFTYHGEATSAIAGTHSASTEEIKIL
ncbi:MAG: phytanoyl-CoA dioxygenase family protein [Gammaproteobacteria bacterium]|nr:phytanoyl-CoA dioxygenase family protein [Gammaproteobacteria bacterium]